ncbi:glycosyltransferase family 2 protein [Candidatus Woesearchaeota archaeon]|nr:glycosyltransferase family 2 protein [Candidatus Woesearchaeota archaeon]
MKFKLASHLLKILILVSLVVIIVGKAFFTNSPNMFLLIYGITVTSVIFLTFSISLRYKDPSIKIREKDLTRGIEKPLISCILAVKNDEKIIARCIDSLINSDYENKEIIVVNDASTDKTKEILKNYNNLHGITIINLNKNIGKKRAISEGLRIAKGEIFVFTDSDCVVASDAISRIIEIFMIDKKVGAVSGLGQLVVFLGR